MRKLLVGAADTGDSKQHIAKVRRWRWLFGNKIQISLELRGAIQVRVASERPTRNLSEHVHQPRNPKH
jgi:hypothetical protein